jgi:glycine dehydrogenase subunit 1
MPDYIPSTTGEQQEMLAVLGLQEIKDLFTDIGPDLLLDKALDLPPALSEIELSRHMRQLAGRNVNLENLCCFRGAGAYDHYIPAVVKNLVARQEFYTAYTPYQPEISQGTLQSIFEYQTMICELTGMDLANASMYDGASALAEAALMACRETRRERLLVCGSVQPDSRAVLATYARMSGLKVETLAWEPQTSQVDLAALTELLADDTAALIVQNPNFFGNVEDLRPLADLAHSRGAMLIASCDPIALALYQAPGDAGADIVVGEGQSLGNSLSFGGPYLGFFAARQDLMRRIPGRIVGETTDARGQRCFVLTIQTREQHIRRAKATSNICSNQALNALAATIYLALLGRQGLREAAGLCLRKAHYLYERLLQLEQFQPVFSQPFFKEFAVRYSGDLPALNRQLFAAGFLGGLELEHCYPDLPGVWLLAVTEKRSKNEMDRLVAEIERIIGREKGAGSIE